MNTREQQFIVHILFRTWRKRYGAIRIPKFQITTDHWNVGVFRVSGNQFRLKGYRYRQIPGSKDWQLSKVVPLLTNLGFKFNVVHIGNTLEYHMIYGGVTLGKFYDMR